MFGFLNSSLAQATQRFIAFGIEKDSIEQQRNTFSMLLNVHILIALLLLILCETIGLWFFYNKLIIPTERLNSAFWVMQCSIATLMVSVTQVPYNASIFGHEKMDVYAYISILEVSLKLCVVILLQHFFSDKLIAYGIMLVCVQLLIAMIYRFYCIHKFQSCHYHLSWSNSLFKKVFSFSSWSLIGNLAFTLNNQGMNFLINIFFGPLYNAAKGIAASVESAVSSFVTNFLGATIPQIIKSYASGDLDYCFRLNFKSSKLGFFLFMLVSLPLISVINPILSLWLVDVPQFANEFCVLSLFYIQANTMGGTLQNVAQATGKIRNFQLSNGIFKLLPLPFVYVFYKMGAEVRIYLYVLIVFSVIGLFVQLAAIRSLLKEYPVVAFLKNVTMIEIVTFIIPCFISIKCYQLDYSGYMLPIAISGGVFLISAIFIWVIGLTKSERIWVKTIILKKISGKKM